MTEVEIYSLEPNDALLQDLGFEIWLMDDHRWAFYAWKHFSAVSGINRFTLVHVDYHWDSVNEFRDDEHAIAELRSVNLDDLYRMVNADDLIGFDSFIAPAIILGLVNEVHFFCRQDDGDLGLDDDLLGRYGARQTLHNDIDSLAAVRFEQPVIFDLCLDLFNNSDRWGEGDLWPDVEVVDTLRHLRPVIEMAALVTVSLSFNYSGSEEDTQHLASLILPLLTQWRHAQ
ncbi:UPF0489 family protein [Burkholderia sp. Ac-20353]|uniref:UPF0489 family protein n=1 Tax=Burkholderia sp. Ac-20353 TaxID=2703894 RepID=UPI00197C083E|nr:hypothetical protein [Burkholderia sp. Ac-20353]